MSGCPFCRPQPATLLTDAGLVYARLDGNPLTPGHALVIPKRHFTSPFNMTPDEWAVALTVLVAVRNMLYRSYEAHGFNVGWNFGDCAGQTVHHAHIHVIPRQNGDVPDPRGGIRANALPTGPHPDEWV